MNKILLLLLFSTLSFADSDKIISNYIFGYQQKNEYIHLDNQKNKKPTLKKYFKNKTEDKNILFLFDKYETKFYLPIGIMEKIAKIESDKNINCVNYNKNGTIDYGIMQINSIHLKELEKFGITKNNIMNPEVNIFAGAYLIKKAIIKDGENLTSIAKNYHSRTPYYMNIWLTKLMIEIKKDDLKL